MPTLYGKIKSIFDCPPGELKSKTIKRITLIEDDKIIIEFSEKTHNYIIRVKTKNEKIMVASGDNINEKILVESESWNNYINELYQDSLSKKETEQIAINNDMATKESARANKINELKTKIDNVFK